MSNSMALAKRPSDTELMPPPPIKRMKRPPKVLTEEDYSAGLDYIVARDFFPGLLEADAQQDYLNAIDSGDTDWMEEAGQRVKAVMTPREPGRRGVSMTPRRSSLADAGDARTPVNWRGATPSRTPAREGQSAHQDGGEAREDREQTKRTNMSLSSYQATYTSEDSTSFANIIDEQNAKRRQKYRWLWSGTNKLPSKQQLAQRQLENQKEHTKALTAPEYFSARYTGPPSSSTALIKSEDARMSLESLDPTKRPAMVDKRPHQPRNGLMFSPDDMSVTHPHLQSQADAAGQRSRAGPKAVTHANTRLQLNAEGFPITEDDDELDRPASPTISAVDAALQGRPHPSLAKGGIYADSDAGDTNDGSETPMVNGWKFVDADVPVESRPASPPKKKDKRPEIDHDALLTSLIQSHNPDDEDSSGSNPFNIADQTKRESLHHALVEKQNLAKRSKNDRLAALKGQDVGETPRFISSPRVGAMPKGGETPGAKRGVGNLTPAGRMLYEKLGRTPVRR